MIHPADVGVRECTDRNIRLIDPPARTPAPTVVACEVCGVTLVGVLAVVDHHLHEHPVAGSRRR